MLPTSWLRVLVLPAALQVLPVAHAAPNDCIGQSVDGRAVCSKPLVSEWLFGLCDDTPSSLYRGFVWCTVDGGTNTASGGCTGRTPVTEGSLFSRAQAFENIVHSPYSCTGSDSGWGKTVTSYNCWSGSPTYKGSVLVFDLRQIDFVCKLPSPPPITERVVALRTRQVACPPPTATRVLQGSTVCVHPANSCPSGGIGDPSPTVANPIQPADGRKVQTDDDGEFEGWRARRYYSSIGSAHHYGSLSDDVSFDQTWRGEFDIKVESVTDSPYVTVALSTPDGTIQYFSADGKAVLPTSSYGARLTSGSGGYQLRTDDEFMQFNSNGRLTNLMKFGGGGLAFVYADGTTGPEGQVAVDANGRSLSVPVPLGSLISIISSKGRVVRYQRDTAGKITQLAISNSSNAARYFYDSGGMLGQVTYPDSSSKYYYYNETANTSGAVLPMALTGVGETNPTGGVSRFANFTYDSVGRATTSEHANGADRHVLSFPTPFLQTTVVDPTGSTRTYSFQTVGGVLKPSGVSQPGGSGCGASSSKTTYDASGNLASRDDFNGTRACYASDPSRNLETARIEGLAGNTACTAVVAANAALPTGSRKTSSQWHPDWRVATRVAEPGRITTGIYNGQPDPFAGNALSTCAPSTALLPDGKPIVVLCKEVQQATTDASGASGFTASLQSGVANRIQQWTYNQFGQVLTSTDPLNNTTTNTYYANTAFAGADPNAVGHTLGDLQATANAVGKVTQYTKYDKHGHLLESIDPNGVVTTYSYDLRQRLLSASIGGQTTGYAYDPVGQLTRVTQPDASWVGYEYDPAHRVVATKDNLGNRIELTLDSAGNVIAQNVKDPGGVLARSVSRSFDALGRVQQTTGRP